MNLLDENFKYVEPRVVTDALEYLENLKESAPWHEGPPPVPGWYNASTTGRKDIFRHWDGARWSQFVEVYAGRLRESGWAYYAREAAANKLRIHAENYGAFRWRDINPGWE